MGNVTLYVFLGLVGIIGVSWLYSEMKYPEEGLFADDATDAERTVPQVIPRTAMPDLQQVSTLIHEKTNQERQAAGVRDLSYDNALADIALAHSEDMASRDYYAHDSPEGDGPQERYRNAGYRCFFVAENIFFHGRDNLSAEGLASSIMEGWMNSPGHRENILRPQFTREGIGIAYDEDQRAWLATQNFC